MIRPRDICVGIAMIVLAAAGWQVTVMAGWGNRALLPPPSAILVVLGQLVVEGEFWRPVLVTLGRLFAGIGIAVMVGSGLGILTGSFAIVEEMIEPLLEAVRALPKVALVPVLVLLVGIGDLANITSIALAGLFPVWANVLRGVRHIDPILRDSAVMLRMSRVSWFRKIVLPAVLPDIFGGTRVALGICFVVAVLSEMTLGSDGLGSLIIDMQRSFRVRELYAWIVILAALGVATNTLLAFGERGLVFWADHRNYGG